jgi:DNA-binding transcriptional MerR regulator
MAAGMSERDIIRTLKGEGYSFGDVERALAAVVKEGIGVPSAVMPQPQPAQAYTSPPQHQEQSPQPEYAQPAYSPTDDDYSQIPATQSEPMPEDQIAEAEAAMEEMLESVLENKLQKFSTDLKGVREELTKISEEIMNVKKSPAVMQTSEVPHDFIEKVDDLEARVGGLEKAFRQFLPSLTENIESLAKMIHELRGRNAQPLQIQRPQQMQKPQQ